MGIDVLRYIDVVVGFSVVMLLASTLVTAITQAVVRFLNLRGRNLRTGVVQLIKQVDPLLEPHAQAIAECVLKHRLVAEPESILGRLVRWPRDQWRGWGLKERLGGVIQREELIRVLAELAATGLPDAAFAGKTEAERKTAAAAVQQQLKEAIGADPAALLRGIRERALELERNAPWLATHVRQTQAIIDAAANDVVGTATQFVARVNAWFDNSMDRVSQSFAQHTRLLTIVGAAIVACGLPLDSFGLLKRLSVDDNFRNALVQRGQQLALDQEAKERSKEQQPNQNRPKEQAPKEPPQPGEQQQPQEQQHGAVAATNGAEDYSFQIEREKIRQQLAELQNPQLGVIPDEWWFEPYFSTGCQPTPQLTSSKDETLTFLVAGKPLALEQAVTMQAVSDAINKSGAPVRAETGECDLTCTHKWLAAWKESPPPKKGSELIVVATANRQAPSIELQVEPGKRNLLTPMRRFRSEALWDVAQSPGILLSVVLLSLGGPFWFEVLKSGLKLRPMLAGKEDKEREERKSTQDAPTGAAATAPAAPPTAPPAAQPPAPAAAAPPTPAGNPDKPESEMGDLNAVDAEG